MPLIRPHSSPRFPRFLITETVIHENEEVFPGNLPGFTSIIWRRYLGAFGRTISTKNIFRDNARKTAKKHPAKSLTYPHFAGRKTGAEPEGRSALSFASQKRTIAFYSSKENAPFAVNPVENVFPEKMCRNSHFFASNSGNYPPGEVIRARTGPGSGTYR